MVQLRRAYRLMILFVPIFAAVGVTVSVAQPASAQSASAESASAVASCTGTSERGIRPPLFAVIPSVGNNTGNFNCDLGPGNLSPAVGDLQRTLNHCYQAGLHVDNDYGPLTKAAVKEAQQDVNITADGMYGPVTRDHIQWVASDGRCHLL